MCVYSVLGLFQANVGVSNILNIESGGDGGGEALTSADEESM